MTIKDRGNIKWTSLMLVEHKEKLKKLKEEEKNREKPELTGDELQRLDYMLREALQEKLEVVINYYRKKRFQEKKGQIVECDSINNEITLKAGQEKMKISLSNIVDIKVIG